MVYIYGLLRLFFVQTHGILSSIERHKPLFVEPTNKDEFHQAMEQYYAKINEHTAHGAIFAGVCRGKVPWCIASILFLFIDSV